MNDGVQVRPATVDDARGIARVLVDGWKTTYDGILPAAFLASFTYDGHEAATRQHLAQLQPSTAAFVAVDDRNSVLGVALVRTAQEQGAEFAAELDAIYVLPSAQRRGVGRCLLSAVARWLDDRGHSSMSVWVVRGNRHRTFYERMGAELLDAQRQQDFGGVNIALVGYAWRDLGALRARD